MSITQNVVVEEGEVASEAVAVAGSVRVDGEVRGDVVAVGGSATINGRVGGEVTAVGGSVRLGPNAEVMHNVTSVGGRVERAEGAEVHGEVNEVSLWSAGGRRAWRRGWDHDPDVDIGGGGGFGEFLGSIVWIVFLSLIGAVALLLARGPIERIERQVATDAWRSAAVGFLVQLLILPITLVVSIVLLVSVIGWPLFLLYPFIALGLLIAAFLGFVGVALRLGRWVEGRGGRAFVNPYFAVFGGVVLIQLAWTVGRLLGIIDGFLGPIAGFTMLVGFLAQYLAWTTGLGAALLAWSQSRRERRWVAAPPPPPAPEPGPEYHPDYGTSPGTAALPPADRPAWPEGAPGGTAEVAQESHRGGPAGPPLLVPAHCRGVREGSSLRVVLRVTLVEALRGNEPFVAHHRRRGRRLVRSGRALRRPVLGAAPAGATPVGPRRAGGDPRRDEPAARGLSRHLPPRAPGLPRPQPVHGLRGAGHARPGHRLRAPPPGAEARRRVRDHLLDERRRRSAGRRRGADPLERCPRRAGRPRAGLAQVVDLKFFCGFTLLEIAEMQSVTERTVQRHWDKARIYLHRSLRDAELQ